MLFTMFNPQTDIRIRKPAVAGQFYPGNAEELKAQVKHCFRKYAKQQGRKDVVAVIVPHADMSSQEKWLPRHLPKSAPMPNMTISFS
jgi:hypothetical protein